MAPDSGAAFSRRAAPCRPSRRDFKPESWSGPVDTQVAIPKIPCKKRHDPAFTNLKHGTGFPLKILKKNDFQAMRRMHGPPVIFFLVAVRDFLILSTCDLATSLWRFCNNLLFGKELALRGCVLCGVGSLWLPCVFGCNARIEGLRILRLPDVKPPCLTCPRPLAGGFFLADLHRPAGVTGSLRIRRG